ILLTLSNPPISLPAVLKLTDSFGSLSRYNINWSKSEAMPLNPHTFQADLVGSPFVWKTSGMKYLGVNIVFPITKIFRGTNSLLTVLIEQSETQDRV
uniref:Uncharacterized protein n=1 Tax=Oncorhynchus mykiss TaxID=8022 RepID=A0A8C7UW27_ONCMY